MWSGETGKVQVRDAVVISGLHLHFCALSSYYYTKGNYMTQIKTTGQIWAIMNTLSKKREHGGVDCMVL